jgi:formylglycine-generating enzyme required for sulfatase activity
MDRAGWYQDNTIGRIQPVRRLWPNDLGLFDVLGNAREMCLTRPGGYCHGRCQFPEPDVEDPALLPLPPAVVTRGGSFLYTESGLLSSHRSSCDTRNVPNDVGFRLARTLPP